MKSKVIYIINGIAFLTGVLGFGGFAGAIEFGDAKEMVISFLLCGMTALLALVSYEIERSDWLKDELEKSYQRNRNILDNFGNYIDKVRDICDGRRI